MNPLTFLTFLAVWLSCFTIVAVAPHPTNSVYLFTSFRGNGEDGLRFLYSFDAYHWTNVPGVFLKPNAGPSKLMRDPSLLRGPEGNYHLVWTSGWHGDQGFGYANSKDLIHWSEQQFIPVMTNQPGTVNVWAPELFYDDRGQQFLICWASTIPSRFPDHLEDHTNNHRLYYTTTRDFKTFTPARLFFDPGFSVIDGFIAQHDARYVLLHKDNSRPRRNLRVASSASPLGPWREVSEPFTSEFTEGPCCLNLGEDWIVYYDAYQAGVYGAARTRDFKIFTDITKEVSFPAGHKHGTAMVVDRRDLNRLLQAGSGKVTTKKSAVNSGTPEQAEAAYTLAIEGRTREILALLSWHDQEASNSVYDAIIAQYRALKAWHETNAARLRQLQTEAAQPDKNKASEAKAQIETAQASLKSLHSEFLGKLSAYLTPTQVDQVKDRMTYNKVQVTYDAYVEIVPGLSAPEKARILELLKEAREEAMDGGSADKKSAIFKKYKGKINNYLSAQGRDVAKAYKDWGQKQKTKAATGVSPSP